MAQSERREAIEVISNPWLEPARRPRHPVEAASPVCWGARQEQQAGQALRHRMFSPVLGCWRGRPQQCGFAVFRRSHRKAQRCARRSTGARLRNTASEAVSASSTTWRGKRRRTVERVRQRALRDSSAAALFVSRRIPKSKTNTKQGSFSRRLSCPECFISKRIKCRSCRIPDEAQSV